MYSSKTLNKISAAKRIELAREIASRNNWDELGLQFEKELNGVTFSRGALVAEKGEHATPIILVQHLIEKLAALLLLVLSFKRALHNLGMADIVEKFAGELHD